MLQIPNWHLPNLYSPSSKTAEIFLIFVVRKQFLCWFNSFGDMRSVLCARWLQLFSCWSYGYRSSIWIWFPCHLVAIINTSYYWLKYWGRPSNWQLILIMFYMLKNTRNTYKKNLIWYSLLELGPRSCFYHRLSLASLQFFIDCSIHIFK